MKRAHLDATDIPDVTSNLTGVLASSGAFSPDPSSGIVRPTVNDGMLRDRELTRVRPLSALGLPSRITNALLRSGINSVGQLISRSREDLITEITGLGERSLKIIEAAVALEDLELAPPEVLSSAFTRTSRAKNNRHIKNHNTWVTRLAAAPSRSESTHPTEEFQRPPVPKSAAEGSASP